MHESPGGEEIISVVGSLSLVKIDDPPHAEFVAIGIGHHGKRCEVKPSRLENEVVGDKPRGLKVLFHKGRRHRQGFRRVVKACFIGGIDRELPRRPDVDTGQVADRVVILGVAQPPRQHPPRIAGVFFAFVFANRLDPVDDALSGLSGRMPLRFRRWHRATLELFEDEFPLRQILGHRVRRGVGTQIQLTLRLLLAVAAEAITLQKRADGAP